MYRCTLLFNLYIETILRVLEVLPGFITESQNFRNIRYANNPVVIADTDRNTYRKEKINMNFKKKQ